jgi:hypothetical protein
MIKDRVCGLVVVQALAGNSEGLPMTLDNLPHILNMSYLCVVECNPWVSSPMAVFPLVLSSTILRKFSAVLKACLKLVIQSSQGRYYR